jgi:RNA polymerase sigma-70 factor (ECF subfamily)
VVESNDTDLSPSLSESLATHRDSIYRYVLSIVRDSPTAEDLTQETLLRAQRNLTSLDDVTRLVPWLYRIATNVCHDRFRQASYRHRPASLDSDAESAAGGDLAQTVADAAPRLDKVMEQKEMSSCVQHYLTGLSDSYRAVILLHDAEGLTNPEIAAMLGVSLPTVKIRLHRARTRLREALDRACSFSTDERGVFVCDPKPDDSGH